MSLNLVVIDYGIGNVRSILNAFKSLGIMPVLSHERQTILDADGVILPGVGAFPQGMRNLQKFSLVEPLKLYADSNKPLLGICLGMQLLFDGSDEFEVTRGLGLIDGRVIKFPVNNSQKIRLPHAGWSEIEQNNCTWQGTILENVDNYSDMYFVHSYVVMPEVENILSSTSYLNYKYCSSVKSNNIYGCQFHPEKSAEGGLRIINNFITICKENKNAR